MAYQSPRRMRPLNVGDVVSGGISLLRSHFKTYSGLSLKAALWYLIPVYGWARGLMIFAQIGRLGFQEVVHQPETPAVALRKVEPRMWSFLGVAFLVGIIQLAINYAISAVAGVVIVPLAAMGAAGAAAAVLSGVLVVLVQVVVFAAQTWIQARFWLYDMIIAMEPDKDATSSISRSWELTQGSATRVLFVLLVSYLVMLPLYLLTLVPFLFTIPFFSNTTGDGGSSDIALGIAFSIALLVFIILLFFAIVLAAPFFQSIKAVLYYDLRSRREGLDIRISDRPQDRRNL
ncbi:hypothetical protein PN498_13695 [Oscillatoria sp. CS-180]|uniref:hypothetical protein n=1 Tax=Oscillatoria sp. CS-180 TaxID=3021720 RepID=UPI00232A933B|nr:hypothetical protein [Oscillatoria sp. CS-180]MDB9527049.1 hypothetical protein [Oscillatoria sp. CS-180]